MAIPINDNENPLHNKPLSEIEQKKVGSAYVDWDSITEVNNSINIFLRKNKYFRISGDLYRCEDDGVTYSLIGGKSTTWTTTSDFFDVI